MRFLGILAFSMLLSNVAIATEIGMVKEGAVSCISQKYLDKYTNLMESNAVEFAESLISRAQCVVHQKPVKAVVSAQTGNNLQVETVTGFKVWIKSDNFEKQ